MTQSKIQLLYDYLTKPKEQGGVGLLNETQLEIWESDSKTYAANALDGSTEISKRREFQCNVLIDNLTPDDDRDQIEFALIWWLNLYEPDHNPKQERLVSDPDIKDRLVTNLWIGFKLTEKSRLKEGKVERCIQPLTITDAPYPDLMLEFEP
jgi:hypothetical protein